MSKYLLMKESGPMRCLRSSQSFPLVLNFYWDLGSPQIPSEILIYDPSLKLVEQYRTPLALFLQESAQINNRLLVPCQVWYCSVLTFKPQESPRLFRLPCR